MSGPIVHHRLVVFSCIKLPCPDDGTQESCFFPLFEQFFPVNILVKESWSI